MQETAVSREGCTRPATVQTGSICIEKRCQRERKWSGGGVVVVVVAARGRKGARGGGAVPHFSSKSILVRNKADPTLITPPAIRAGAVTPGPDIPKSPPTLS